MVPDITFTVDPLRYQSQSIHSFSEWISLFTLCLAPLIAHIVAGVPSASFLHESRPKWHQRLCHYNPTSIIWRYAMITDRWIRCSSWDNNAVAATNALFWTAEGWDGSEEMIEVSYKHCLYLPETTRVPILSSEMMKTLIVTLQGAQSIYTIVSGVAGSLESSNTLNSLALDTIFFPLAVMGLLRLFCAFWLTSDYAYAAIPTSYAAFETSHLFVGSGGNGRPLEYSDEHTVFTPPKLRPVSYWASRAYRILFLLPLLGLWTIPVLFFTYVPWDNQRHDSSTDFSVTLFVLILFYLVLFTSTVAIVLYHFVRGYTSTVLPCIQSVWYRAYSTVLLGLAVALFVCYSHSFFLPIITINLLAQPRVFSE